jgi:hypothetical protein
MASLRAAFFFSRPAFSLPINAAFASGDIGPFAIIIIDVILLF